MAGTEKVDLRGAAATLLMTLYMRRLDARSRRPILGDPYAEAVYDRIEHDVHGLWQVAGDAATIAARAAVLDGWTREFLGTESHGQVLHLGCGLDSRPLRLAVPPTVRWLDVDQPEVIDVRRRLYTFPEHVVQVAGSVTGETWWEAVDPDRPTLVVAEGLFMYLRPATVHAVVDRVVDGTRRAELAFDAVSPWTVTMSRWTPTFRALGTGFRWAWNPADFAHRHPTLRELDDVAIIDELTIRHPRVWLRPLLSAAGHLPTLQDAMRLHRFTTR
ncbi:class I SAM-dependent methyltransferase [Pseudonocardia kongjuensis]|uniref:Class I SAM-dependent methyltransferase n=1 Tax=Pseudonocardia kongjuensis TaxID=102227 RepID=A0ABP4IWX0_9PSEU